MKLNRKTSRRSLKKLKLQEEHIVAHELNVVEDMSMILLNLD